MMRSSLFLLLISVLARNAMGLVGSQNALLGDFNWMGSLRDVDKMHVCGVVLVDRNWALTSGHCVGSTGYTLEFGHVVRGGGYVYQYDNIYRHPLYDQGEGYYPNDIALIQVLGSGVEVDHLYSKPITTFDNGSVEINGESCWIAGWGALSSGGDPSSQLQKAEIPLIGDMACTNEWGASYYNPALNVCAYNATSQAQGLCEKDEGGSLVCSDDSGSITLVGLGSFFYSGCEPSYPSVFVRISAFGAWACATTNGAVCW